MLTDVFSPCVNLKISLLFSRSHLGPQSPLQPKRIGFLKSPFQLTMGYWPLTFVKCQKLNTCDNPIISLSPFLSIPHSYFAFRIPESLPRVRIAVSLLPFLVLFRLFLFFHTKFTKVRGHQGKI